MSLKTVWHFCGLTEEEMLAIADHEQLPEIAAIAMGQYMLGQEYGTEKIFTMIAEDIRNAQQRRDTEHVRILLQVLHHFVRAHSEAAPRVHPWHKLY